ncbi:MAG: DNA-3-methyladenine glycosylase I [Paracoccaceae bacterium]|jgi:DNA-3-methyladenine glycosylase I
MHANEPQRCPWCGQDPIYETYHDEEWGVPERDSRALFEKLILDGFQAGLSWITILRKRPAFRQAFEEFNPHVIARWVESDVEKLLKNVGIVRHGGKIRGAIASARAYENIEEKVGFDQFLWRYMDGKALQNRFITQADVPPKTALSERISKDLKAQGFTYCGPTIVYAFMEAVGMVNDHLITCARHEQVAKL